MDMDICIYIYIHIHMSIWVCIYEYNYLNMNVTKNACVYICTYIYIYIYMCVCVYVYVCMYEKYHNLYPIRIFCSKKIWCLCFGKCIILLYFTFVMEEDAMKMEVIVKIIKVISTNTCKYVQSKSYLCVYWFDISYCYVVFYYSP